MSIDDRVTAGGVAFPDPVEIGGHQVERKLHQGRSTTVYLCRDDAGTKLIVKLMQPPFDESLEEVSRFLHAARGLMDLKHPNVVEVYSFGREFDRPYLVCEYVDGENVSSIVGRDGALRPLVALDYARQVASGLRAAFNHGLLHGDVRPSHFVLEPGCLKITGFSQSAEWTTAHGRKVMGDPAYTAPETQKGARADHRSDIYSLGCSLFEMLTARTPFGVGAADALLACHVHEPFPRPSSVLPHIPGEVDELVRKLTSKNPNSRPQTYEEVLEAIEEVTAGLDEAAGMGPRLVVEIGRQTGLSVELPEGELLLGRDEAGFFVDDGRVSRRHAIVHRDGHELWVEDLGSRNGIRINGERTGNKELLPGDRLGIGDTVLVLVADEVSQPVPQAAKRRPATSPVRGAYGEAEVSHAPNKQAGPDTLSGLDVGDPRLALEAIAAVARVLAVRPGVTAAARAMVQPLSEAFGADGGVYVRTEDGKALPDAESGAEAEALSCVLPAVERAAPGGMALATTVRAGRAGAWGVLLAPVRRAPEEIEGYLVLYARQGRFGRPELSVLETACALLSARAQSLTG